MDKIDELLTRGVANIIPNKDALAKTLSTDKKLNVYLGIDPTATQIHLGHAVPLRKLQAFADLGHLVTFLIGDFTALIGDTSDKDSERPVLSKKQIEQNFQTYKKQAEKILDFSKVKVRHNSEWLRKLSFEEIIKLCQHFSFGDFASRELIRKRLSESKYVGLHEGLYPVMQGYDSYHMDTDVQIGGTDQTFNMQAGRILQKDLRNKDSYVLSTTFLLGTDGRKMSKTWGNAIWLTDKPKNMFGKILSLKDDLIRDYFILATKNSMEEIDDIGEAIDNGENPMLYKKKLAFEIVEELYDKESAKEAQEYFEKTVQHKEIPDNIPTLSRPLSSGATITDALVESGIAPSKSEARRLITQGGTAVADEIINDPDYTLPSGELIIRGGKRKFSKVKVE